MLKREEIEDYFREIIKLENDMVYYYEEFEKVLKKKEWKEVVRAIKKQEIAHVKIAEELLKIAGTE
ncbi:MAG TPA: hypothetical protein VJC00_02265 [Candidatus Nanoarchaeia archaeon]|nr:hypothetical protein [Candidatus Nanoarchaeia archaeon]